MATTTPITTADQLLQAADLGPCELIRGELVMMTPAGCEHSQIAVAVAAALLSFVSPRKLGIVVGADGGFVIARDPDTVRAPDAAFIAAARVPAQTPQGYFEGAPDLAVEVLSPNDRVGEVNTKVDDWLAAGCRSVWVVDPKTRSVWVHRGRSQITACHVGENIEEPDLLPGFILAVGGIFAG